MKAFSTVLFFVLFIVLLLPPLHSQSTSLPFSKGFNLHGWFENIGEIKNFKFKKYTKQDFIDIKSLGGDHVRLAIEFFDWCGPAPEYTLNPLLYRFLDEVVDWAEDLGMYIILDNHSFSDTVDTSTKIEGQLLKVWKQVAGHYKNRSRFVYYEILNEPHNIYAPDWYLMQQHAIETIRSEDSIHAIVVGGANWYGCRNMFDIPEYKDTNLVYTFHFYDPMLFTSMKDMGVPFPYDSLRMPKFPLDDTNSWHLGLYNNYPVEGQYKYLQNIIDSVLLFRAQRKVPVWCGEMGALATNSGIEDRARWFGYLNNQFETNKIPWTIWAYKGWMGIYKINTLQLFNHDLCLPIVDTLGLIAPVQSEPEIKPCTTGFYIYDDFLPRLIEDRSWQSAGSHNFMISDGPLLGEFCIEWEGAERYNTLSFQFGPVKDLSYLKDNNYVLSLWVKSVNPGVAFDLRFIDTKDTSLSGDRPWRSTVTINEGLKPYTGEWQNIKIPLSDFIEAGAFEDNHLYEPTGSFDWSRIEYFEIVAEHSSFANTTFYFDEIRIDKPVNISKTNENLYSNPLILFPNPASAYLNIKDNSPGMSDKTIYIADETGRTIIISNYRKLSPEFMQLDIRDLPSGLYTVFVQGNSEINCNRFVKLY